MKNNQYILPIVILNWNGFKDTQECIDSILHSKEKDYLIYLIDNNSGADEIDLLRKHFSNHPQIKLIFNDKNLGFVKAHNLVLNEIIKENYSYVFLLNNDTILPEGSLEYIINRCKKNDFDLLSSKLINFWDQTKIDSAGHQIISSGEILPVGHNQPTNNYNTTFENIGASAGAGIYSVEMLKNIGIFDDYFITGYEDTELGLRAICAGYESIFDPDFVVLHKKSQSISKVFNFDFAFKAQCNIFYTYFKLIHWQILLLNLIPWILRFVLLIFMGLILLRFKFVKVQLKAFFKVFIENWKSMLRARKNARVFRKIKWFKLFTKQKFFLLTDIKRFYRFVIKQEKSYFENYQ